ncbi:MAG: SufD family Fe-S cluster assembly protein [Flavobacteriales bacterium]|nr:SufD family Fe-S cluster assembly protein [Flavobacteriales bacterium]MCX7768989.1 SufD family Fe-S cluster assembly protein [Flavobacteriales bacterium]MDW8410264.1 SufD family Fe-S cluster assembly protein [Flavobacteriales bacterium]
MSSIQISSPSVKESYKYTSISRLWPGLGGQNGTAHHSESPIALSLTHLARAVSEILKHLSDPLLQFSLLPHNISKIQSIGGLDAFQNFPEHLSLEGPQQIYHYQLLSTQSHSNFFNLLVRSTLSQPAIVNLYAVIDPGKNVEIQLDCVSQQAFPLTVNVVFVVLEGGHLHVNQVLRGCGLMRCNIFVILHGEGSQSHFNGVVLSGQETHHDLALEVRHLARETRSLQKVRILGWDASVSAFGGKIFVAPQAPLSEAYLEARSLALSEESFIYGRPFLEIYTDNVRCSHGYTTGSLDENALHYLRCRAIPEQIARQLLIQAFVKDIFPSSAVNTYPQYLISILENHICNAVA